jgi:hypothetical protein
MSGPSAEEVKRALTYDPETGVFTRRTVLSFNPKSSLGKPLGTLQRNGYLGIRVGDKVYRSHRLAWFYMHGVWPKEIDHVNGVKTDNRIANLREASRSQNMANAPLQKNNASGVKGVHFDKANGRWMAYMQVNGRFKNLGRFDDRQQAIAARQVAAKRVFGEFARA